MGETRHALRNVLPEKTCASGVYDDHWHTTIVSGSPAIIALSCFRPETLRPHLSMGLPLSENLCYLEYFIGDSPIDFNCQGGRYKIMSLLQRLNDD